MANYELNLKQPEKNLINSELSARLNKILAEKKLTISVAESFTSGRISVEIVKTPGASKIFFEGAVTYHNDAKMQRLNVSKETLERYGAVSPECAYEMATGLLKGGNCDIAVSSTGIAGPASDDTSKPVGLCFIGVAVRAGVYVYEYHLSGSREDITEAATSEALYLAVLHAEKI